jgi:hypothetical protein
MAMTDHNGPEEQADDPLAGSGRRGTPWRLGARGPAGADYHRVEQHCAEDIGMPVFFVIPNSGRAILSFTPGDPQRRMGARERNRDIHCRSVGRTA